MENKIKFELKIIKDIFLTDFTSVTLHMEASVQCNKSYCFILTNFWHNRELAYTAFWSKFPIEKNVF